MDQLPLFVHYRGHLINATEVRTVSPWEDGIHIDYRYGGFTNIPGGDIEELLDLIANALKAAAPF